MVQQTVSRYVLNQRLRTLGTHVTCYRASQEGLERDVELRVLHLPSAAGTDAEERFTREYRALASFDHPNLVQVLDVGRTQEHLFYATSHRDARPLEEALAAGNLDEGQVARAAHSVGSGLGYLHAHGFMHCSLSPATLFLERSLNRFFIGDYSTMAALIEGRAPPGAVAHSVRLASTPEAARMLPFDVRTDLFLLAATLYRMLTGVDPLAAGNARAGTIVLPSVLSPGMSRELEGFLMKALEKDPAARFQETAEFVAAADAVQKKLELKDLVEKSAAVQTVELPESAPPPPPAAYSRAQIRAATRPGRPTPTERSGASEPIEDRMLSRADLRRAVRPEPGDGARKQAGEIGRVDSAETGELAPRPSWLLSLSSLADRARGRMAWLAASATPLMERLPADWRLPAALGAALLLVALIAMSGGPDERGLPEPGGRGRATSTPGGSGALTHAPSRYQQQAERIREAVARSAAEVQAQPTSLQTFRDRWQALRRWYLSLPAEKRSEFFTWETLIQTKIEFASDPGKASRKLDELYEQAAPVLSGL